MNVTVTALSELTASQEMRPVVTHPTRRGGLGETFQRKHCEGLKMESLRPRRAQEGDVGCGGGGGACVLGRGHSVPGTSHTCEGRPDGDDTKNPLLCLPLLGA